MIKFTVRERCRLKPEMDQETIISIVRNRVDKCFRREKFTIETDRIIFKGTLPSFWECTIVEAVIRLKIEDSILSYQIEGDISPDLIRGWWQWLVAISVFFLWGIGAVIGMIVICVILFLPTVKRPERYFSEIFDAIRFNHGLPG